MHTIDGLDIEELLSQASNSTRESEGEEDVLEGWVDEHKELSTSDLKELEDNVQPVQKTLVKVHCKRVWSTCFADVNINVPPQLCRVAYAMKNSPLLIHPKWFLTLDELKLGHHMMPQDVLTQWNSTYNMLLFALKYQDALDIITGDCNTKLCLYEMDNNEWAISQQLCEVLKDSHHFIHCAEIPFAYPCVAHRFSRMLHFFSPAMEHQTLQQSSLPWITLTKSQLPMLSTLSILFQYKPPLKWVRRCLINIAARLTTPKFTGLL